jgi:hypothetical protein
LIVEFSPEFFVFLVEGDRTVGVLKLCIYSLGLLIAIILLCASPAITAPLIHRPSDLISPMHHSQQLSVNGSDLFDCFCILAPLLIHLRDEGVDIIFDML